MAIPEQPLVSIITPVYNGASYLSECIESVLNQTFQNFEYIILDNCSNDSTLEIANEYAAKDTRIRVYTNERFVGVIENHNAAFRLMSPDARYCKVVSGDDTIFPQCVAEMVEIFEANPSVGIVGSYQVSGSVVKWQGFRYPKTVISGREVGRRCFLGHQAFIDGQPVLGFGAPSSLMYRAEIVRSAPAFYPNASPHADTSACFKTLQTWSFGFVHQVLAFERTHAATQTSTSLKMNRYLSATLNDLLEYGNFYLSESELKHQIDQTLKAYHRFLALSLFIGPRDREFWAYHKTRLAELGYPLTRLDLVKAIIATALEEGVNPGHAIQKVTRLLCSKAQERTTRSQPIAKEMLPKTQ